MDIIKDIIYVNKEAGSKTLESFQKNWLIVFTGFIYTVLNYIIYSLFGALITGPISIFAGIINALIISAMVSNYLYLLFNVINYNRVTIDDFKYGFGYFLRKIYVIIFIGYIARLLLSLPGNMLINIQPSFTFGLYFVVMFLVPLIFNPLAETIYLKSYDPWESIVQTLVFMKENWLNWGIPSLSFFALLYLITGDLYLGFFDTHISFTFTTDIKIIALYSIAQVVFTIMMIYRGHLYKLLSTSTRRKRMFMNKF